MNDTHYLCTQCDFHGTADQFGRHTLSEGYNYGHGNAAPEEVELECPECGLWEQDGIVKAECCDYCEKYDDTENITRLEDADTNICIGCKVKRNIMKGGN